MADPIRKNEKLLVIACGMIAREVLAVKEQLALDHLDLTCLPAGHHFEPQKIPADMERAIAKARADGYDRIFAGFADCGTGGMLDKVLEKHGVERIAGPHCFAFYQGLSAFEAKGDDDMTSFYMTDFLCRHFETFFIRPLGLDRHPELVADYFGHYEKLVYLAQTDEPELDRIAVNAAQMLGLVYEKRKTGYGDLASALDSAVRD
ncbi:MAG: DUF1638 domain-containing protein [Notoacmeibacter sp.]|nr:DUF1638 domain-containing protein [Notoacmeibacter sp.]